MSTGKTVKPSTHGQEFIKAVSDAQAKFFKDGEATDIFANAQEIIAIYAHNIGELIGVTAKRAPDFADVLLRVANVNTMRAIAGEMLPKPPNETVN